MKLRIIMVGLGILLAFMSPASACGGGHGNDTAGPPLSLYSGRPSNPDQTLSGRMSRVAAKNDRLTVTMITYLVRANPKVFEFIDRESADACLASEKGTKDGEADCRAALREIIETIRSLLSTSYGLSKSIGRFDPTTITYSKELTRSLLVLNPERKI